MSFFLFLLFGGLSIVSYYTEWPLWLTITFAILSALSLLFFLAKSRVHGDILTDATDSIPDFIDFDD